MELTLLGGIFLLILAMICLVGATILLRDESSEGLILAVFTIILFVLGLFISIDTVKQSRIRDTKTTSLNYLVESGDVGVKINPFGDMQYELLDSTQVELFNFLMKEIKKEYPKKVEQ